MSIYQHTMLDAVMQMVRYLAPSLALLVIVACLSGGAFVAAKRIKHFGGV